MGSSCGSRLPVRRLPEGPRLRAGWSSWEAGPERFCRGTGFALLPCPPADCRDTVAMNQPAMRSLAAALLAAGIVLAALAGGPATAVAAVLALAILLYDAVLKGTGAGFLNMGVCRGLNFYMPMSLAMKSVPTFCLFAPVLLTAYISVLT